MSSLRAPGLGPIVGHTTSDGARLWIRAADPEDSGAHVAPDRRTVGVTAVVRRDGADLRDPSVHYFRLQREFDRTGTFFHGRDTGVDGRPSPALAPGHEYEARTGTLTIDDPHPDDESIDDRALAARLPDPSVWLDDLRALPEDLSAARWRTFAAPAAPASGPLAFLVGSCRYPGLLWKVKHADAIFGPMLEEAQGRQGRPRADLALMVGDQIYADMLNRHVPIGLADTFEEFQERYLSAFGSRNMRRLLRSLPTYMILDDHEIEDNWTQDRIRRAEKRRIFNLAINAYMSYQWVHGPRNYGRRLFYSFESAGYPFFVLDTRTARFVDDVAGSLADNHLLGRPALPGEEPGQLEVLLAWLREQQTRVGDAPKFVVTSSVFAPNPMTAREGREGTEDQKVRWKEQSDSWPAFPETRRAVLRCLVEHGVQNVVFVSGDIHCSNVAEIRLHGSEAAERLRAFSITSSAFYWPFPFADGEPSSFVHDSTRREQRDTFEVGGGVCMDYRARAFTQEDNFCRVDVDRTRSRITVRAFDRDGDIIRKGGWFGGRERSLVSRLDLAPW